MISAMSSLVDELECALKDGSADQRIKTLRRVTALFLDHVERLDDEKIGVFDTVFLQLTKNIETRALAELSRVLAPVDNAPSETIRALAWNDLLDVAGPILVRSAGLTTADLVAIAAVKGQDHLLAISGRSRLNERVQSCS